MFKEKNTMQYLCLVNRETAVYKYFMQETPAKNRPGSSSSTDDETSSRNKVN